MNPIAAELSGAPAAEVTAPRRDGRRGIPVCRHCGTPLVDERMRSSGFCCAGCHFVFRMVHDSGLESYYRIKDETTAPADAGVFQPRDFAWLVEAQRAAEAGAAGVPELTLEVQGISCAGCVWLIERLFQKEPGGRDLEVNASYGTLGLRWTTGEFSAADFARRLQAFGYSVGPAGEVVAEPESRGLVRRIGLCAAFWMNVMLFSLPAYFGMEPDFEWAGLFRLLALVFGTLSLLVGGSYFLARAWRAWRERVLHIDLPIALGIVGAYAGSLYGWFAGAEKFLYFDFVSSFVLLMLVGRWAQVTAVERNRRRLLRRQPASQRVRVEGVGELPPEKLQAGHILHLGTGQTLPVDSRLESPEAAFSLASINGEPEPRIFRAGQRVPAGALQVGRSDVSLVALGTWKDSLLAKLMEPGRAPDGRHLLLEKIVRGYLTGILAIAFLAGIGWWLETGSVLQTGAVVTAVLVVSCPCAIAVAFPLADEIATVALRRRGVFVREASLWSRLGRVRKLVFDKTGTLTLEVPELATPGELGKLDALARSALLALVRDNPHPISQCLMENLLGGENAAAQTSALPGAVRETIGFGVELGPWSLGRAGWRDDDAGDGTVFARDGEVLARFRFREALRPGAREEVAALSRRGLGIFILSGDESPRVAGLALELGLPPDHAFGNLAPRGKADWIDAHAAGESLMLGDGANDSLCFDRALCRGTPVIHRGVLGPKADFYYLRRDLGGLSALFSINDARRRTHLAVLIFSVAYNVAAVGLAVGGRMSPLLAAALMPINSLLTLGLVTWGMRRALASGK